MRFFPPSQASNGALRFRALVEAFSMDEQVLWMEYLGKEFDVFDVGGIINDS